jgi:hypothetical protein
MEFQFRRIIGPKNDRGGGNFLCRKWSSGNVPLPTAGGMQKCKTDVRKNYATKAHGRWKTNFGELSNAHKNTDKRRGK